MYKVYGKRLLDLGVAVPILFLSSPLLGCLAILIRLRLGSPVLFRQERGGFRETTFVLLKFRTMTDERDPSGAPLSDDQRLTAFGRFLRSTSLDELPTLFNVIRGELSLVGPRPLLSVYLQRYTADQRRRHEVKPGVTGLAQVSGRNALSWQQKFALDVWYVENVSLRLDFNIMVRTVVKLVQREGINQPGTATADEFMGTNT